tara:strand:+ start:92 stop:2104 length:2013 start_codon:yes stop_codon:yes gene_type:complete
MEISRIDIRKKKDALLKRVRNIKENKETELYNKEVYKTTAYNIDSRFRNKDPKNIPDKKIYYLSENSIIFNENSSVVEIKVDNSNNYFDINDRIIIKNFDIDKKIYRNNIYLVNNFNYFIVKIKNHRFKSSVENQKIFINILNPIDDMIGNIPSNILKEIGNIYVYSQITNIPEIIKTTFDDIENNIFFVKIPFNYISNIDIFQIQNTFEISFDSISGIPTKYINADYPVNFERNKGFHKITDVSFESIFIDININANNNIEFNNKNVKLSKIIKTIEGFVDSSYYIVNLPKNFHNVVRIELVSSEFYFIDNLIKDKGVNKNNILYWQNIEDGDFIYKIEMEAGNYTPSNLLNSIVKKTNNVKRKNYTDETPSFNNFEINLDTDKQFVSLTSFKFEILPNSLSIEIISINSNLYYQLTIIHPNNFVEIGDVIKITNCNSIGAVPASIINNSHTIYKINKIFSSYSIILPRFTPNQTNTSGKGGSAITIKSKNLTRFLFDKSDTIGNILGFNYIGETNSITKFSHITTNKDEYIIEKKFDSIGNIDNKLNYFNFNGDNLYLLMYLNDYQSIYSNTSVENAFAKILLPGSLGEAVFNTYVNYPVEFDIPISNIDQFVVKFLYSNGSIPEFNNLEHSFTLLITEKNESHEEIGTHSKNSSFTKKLYEIKQRDF